MIARELVTAVSQTVLAAEPKGINTEGVVTFFASNIAPILLAVLGVIFIGRASRGEISKVLTSSAIAMVQLGPVAGRPGTGFPSTCRTRRTACSSCSSRCPCSCIG